MVPIVVVTFVFLVTNDLEHFFTSPSAVFDEVSTSIFDSFFIGIFSYY